MSDYCVSENCRKDDIFLGSFRPSPGTEAGDFKELKKKLKEIEGIEIVDESSNFILDFWKEQGDV